MDSYISFRYLNKKLLDQYKGLVPVEIECSRRHYNGVDYDTYSYSTIVYYKKENFNPKNYKNVKTFFVKSVANSGKKIYNHWKIRRYYKCGKHY